jgi:hypothetical protein
VSTKDAKGGVNSLRGVAIKGSSLVVDACMTSVERAVAMEGSVKSSLATVVPEAKALSICAIAMEGATALEPVRETSGAVAVEGVAAAGAMVWGKRKKIGDGDRRCGLEVRANNDGVDSRFEFHKSNGSHAIAGIKVDADGFTVGGIKPKTRYIIN